MKILIVSAGTSRDHTAHNSYLEEYIGALTERDIDLACLYTAMFSSLPFSFWKKTSVHPEVYEIYNAGIYSGLYPNGGTGTLTPDRDVRASHKLRKMFLQIIKNVSPDIIHFQNLIGFPVDLIDEIHQIGIRTVYTPHDYLPFCPTAHLFKPDSKPCELTDQELICDECCQRTLSYPAFWLKQFLQRFIDRCEKNSFIWKILCYLTRAIEKIHFFCRTQSGVGQYAQRRSGYRAALKKIDLILCISKVQKEIFLERLGFKHNIRLSYLSRLSIRAVTRSIPQSDKIIFVALNTGTIMKGHDLLFETFQKLQEVTCDFELRIYAEGQSVGRIKYLGRYRHTELDRILEEAHFGIIPSIWYETYGFTGAEMLSRGLPLIASEWAGVSEFIQQGENGLTFNPREENGLFNVLKRVINDRNQRKTLYNGADRLKGSIPAFQTHINDSIKIYQELLKGHS